MELRIDHPGESIDMDRVVDSLEKVDPAVMADLELPGGALRIATVMTTAELLQALGHAGLELVPTDIAYLPAVCCGGCSG